jgi:nucleoside-diphosphate-sugar epimerase
VSAAANAHRVLVTGAAGVLGSRLVTRLIDAGFKVRGLVMPGDPLRARIEQLGCEIREGDIRDASSLRGLCDDVDTVYHLAAIIISHDVSAFGRINLDGSAHLLAVADAARVRHFVYVSSASVTYPRLTPYAQSKLAAERLVAARSGEYTIVRPTLVYDERGGLELRMFLDYLRRFPIVPFIGACGALKRPVWSEDIVDGLLRLVDNPIAFGKTYNFSGGEAISMRDFAHLLLQQHATDRPLLHLPVALCSAAAHVLRRTLAEPPLTLNAIAGVINDANLDPSEATRDLGYQPIGVRAGFARGLAGGKTSVENAASHAAVANKPAGTR